MIPDEHDGHLLPGCQEFEAEIVGDLDQALVRIGVDGMTILEDPLVHGRRGQVDGRIGGIAMLHAAGHLSFFLWGVAVVQPGHWGVARGLKSFHDLFKVKIRALLVKIVRKKVLKMSFSQSTKSVNHCWGGCVKYPVSCI